MTEDRTQAEIDEVRRDRIVWTTLLILGVLVAAGALGLGWRLIEGRLAAAKSLDRAIAILKETDTTVTTVDALVRSRVTTQTAAKVADVAPLVDTARSQLAEAGALAATGTDRLTDDEQKKAALVQRAAAARLRMLDGVPQVLSAMRQSASCQALADEAWAKTLSADKLGRQSVAAYNRLTRADAKKAAAANKKAKAGFTAARALFDEAALAFPEAKLGVFAVYVDGRLELVALSKKAGDAWLAGRSIEANKLRTEYNKSDELAVQRAKQLPGTPAAAIVTAYEELVATPLNVYHEARKKAAEADTALRTL